MQGIFHPLDSALRPSAQICIHNRSRVLGKGSQRRKTGSTVLCDSAASVREPHQVSEGGEASTSGRSKYVNGHPSPNGNGVLAHHEIVDYGKRFSKEAQQRIMPGLRVLATAFTGLPDIIPLHGGLPPADAFPLSGLSLRLRDGATVKIEDEDEVMSAQQYNLTMKGHPALLDWIKEHVQQLHAPPAGHDSILTGGTNYSLEIVMRLFMDPGDSILCEEYTYPHVPESLVLPVDYKSVKVEIDRFGIIPEKLEATLESMKAKGQTIPALLYTIPIGQNPTGATQTLDRKQRIYRICQKYDILIMEDDPYYYLQYTPGQPPQGLQNLGVSYLRMDTDCRVIRFDSFSKSLAPGLRIGWLTAHPDVINKVLFHSHGVAMGPCSLSQVVLGALVRHMGHDGFEQHIKHIQELYCRRADIIMKAAEKHLTGLAEWDPVQAGMFLWIKLLGFEDATQIVPDLQNAKVIVVPGSLTRHSGPDATTPCPYVRLSFVTAPEELLEVAVERLAGVLSKAEQKVGLPPVSMPSMKRATNEEEVL